MNGVTGRMGTNQHLLRSIKGIIDQGGIKVSPEEVIMPDPILVGRNPNKLQHLCRISGVNKMTTNVEEALANPHNIIYFDAQITGRRHAAVKRAIELGKHVYCEKPTGVSTEEALDLYHLAKNAGVKHGVVQDKLWLPGMQKLQRLKESGFFWANIKRTRRIWLLGFRGTYHSSPTSFVELP